MNRYERRTFFEELYWLRAIYPMRSEYDATSVMSVGEAIAYAMQLLDQHDVAVASTAVATELSDRSDSRR
jgi:hypothetical protein